MISNKRRTSGILPESQHASMAIDCRIVRSYELAHNLDYNAPVPPLPPITDSWLPSSLVGPTPCLTIITSILLHVSPLSPPPIYFYVLPNPSNSWFTCEIGNIPLSFALLDWRFSHHSHTARIKTSPNPRRTTFRCIKPQENLVYQ